MINIAIIGAGQIGSRHLQAMANLEFPAIVQLVDPSKESLFISEQRFFDVYNNNTNTITLQSYQMINELREPIDIVIVATTADTRAKVISEIIQKKRINNMILEKFLFQKTEDFYSIQMILDEYKINAWVNCWPRSVDFYRKIKEHINLNERISVKVSGSNWGMGTNGMHFVDLFSFLTDSVDIKISECKLDKEIIDSKRSGFIEFTGKIIAENSRSDSIQLFSQKEEGEPFKLSIKNGVNRHEILLRVDHAIHSYSSPKNSFTENVLIPMQSQSTHNFIHQIIREQKCKLPRYNQTMHLHVTFLKAFLNHLSEISGDELDICQIT